MTKEQNIFEAYVNLQYVKQVKIFLFNYFHNKT